MRKNHFWMMIMCMLPLLLIFLLPVFKINSPGTIFIIFLVMFAAHFFMMGNHSHHEHDNEEHNHEDENQNKKEENHAHHQH